MLTCGISCAEDSIEWTAEVHENISDNITGKRLSPKRRCRSTRREELEFMDNLAVLKEAPIEQCWSENAYSPPERSVLTPTKSMGDQVEIRSDFVSRRT